MKRRISSAREIWTWPLLLTLVSVLALVLALFEDEGLLDLICAGVLAWLVWLCCWHGWLARRLRRVLKR